MRLTKEQRYNRALARREGQTACANGLTLASNPYEAGTDCHCQWDVGFEEAARADDKSPAINIGSHFQNA